MSGEISSINRSSLSQMVFESLREDILNGRYQSGESLVEMKIAKELSVSRTPVRDALHQLEQEGLVVSTPNRGAVVKSLSAKDIEDIYTVRQLLEGLAARWTCERANQGAIDRLGEIVALMELYTKRNDSKKLVQLDTEFHKLLYEACESRVLRQTLHSLHYNSSPSREKNLILPERAANSLREHKAIYEAIEKHDADTADRLAAEHVANAHARAYLQDKQSK